MIPLGYLLNTAIMTRDFASSPYGCVRYRSRPWAAIISKLGTNAFAEDGSMYEAFGEQLKQGLLRPLLDTAIAEAPPAEWPAFEANALREVATAAMHAAWTCFGRQIFHFSAALIEEFRQTDVDASSFEQLHLPYRAFFLHFGRLPDTQFDEYSRESPEYVDGAYVFRDGTDSLVFELTLSRAGTAPSLLPGIQIVIPPEFQTLGAREAIDRAIDQSMNSKPPALDSEKPETLGAALDASRREFLESARSPLIQVACLLSNCLFYLSEYGKDRTSDVEVNAPKDLVGKYLNSAGKQQHKTAQSLFGEGFSVVNYVGKGFELPPLSIDAENGTLAPHWRRGHWRNHRHGPALKQVKRLWIRPVLVRSDLGPSDKGHIYNVPGDASEETPR